MGTAREADLATITSLDEESEMNMISPDIRSRLASNADERLQQSAQFPPQSEDSDLLHGLSEPIPEVDMGGLRKISADDEIVEQAEEGTPNQEEAPEALMQPEEVPEDFGSFGDMPRQESIVVDQHIEVQAEEGA